MLFCLGLIWPVIAGAGWFGFSEVKTVAGQWIKAADYATTVEFFPDGDGRWQDGTFLAWSLLDDGSVKILSDGGDSKRILLGNTEDIREGIIYVDGDEFIRRSAENVHIYAKLAAALDAGRVATCLHRGAMIAAIARDQGQDQIPGEENVKRCAGNQRGIITPGAGLELVNKGVYEAEQCIDAVDEAIALNPLFARSHLVKAECLDTGLRLVRLGALFEENVSSAQQERLEKLGLQVAREQIGARVAAINAGLPKRWRARTYNALAWAHATAPYESLINAPLAIAYAGEAVKLDGRESAYFDTLAAAHARAGDFSAAIRVQTQAIADLPAAKTLDREGYELRLESYRSLNAYTDHD